MIVPVTKKRKKTALWNEAKSLPWLAFVILFILLIMIIFPSFMSSHSPYEMELANRLTPPMWDKNGSPNYPLGTDTLGRDVLARIVYGSRISMLIACFVMITSGMIGIILGVIAGYMGRWVDSIICRFVDSFLAIPSIFLALVFAVVLGQSTITLVLALTLVTWARFTRIIRGDVIGLKSQTFILQAKVAGSSPMRIMMVHILPNILSSIMILMVVNISQTILIEASLSFLGAGVPPPNPSWGQMISEGRSYVTSAYWISLFPGLALALTVLSFQIFGDWLRDKLDPKLRQI
jgi:peptide/nickel transport system permease protein